MKSLLPWTKLHLYIDLKILNQGYVSLLLKSSLQNFYRPRHELVRRLGVTKYPLFSGNGSLLFHVDVFCMSSINDLTIW